MYYVILGVSIKKGAKAKLIDCFNNRRREYKEAGIISFRSRQSITIEPDSLNFDTNNSGN